MLHSYWRWAVLILALFVLVQATIALYRPRAWTSGDERASRWLVSALDFQILLGLILYFGFSPFWTAIHESFQLAMKEKTTRFFGIEHQVAMILAAVAIHAGRTSVRKSDQSTRKRRALLISTVVFFVIIAWAVPWPWRDVGRPLFRVDL